jgi:bifunctional N-acetylglucosamine-1-phosphate-uridyltransferase/glucosamine-1-phosphate-acetyltransferase GlmU-like protein
MDFLFFLVRKLNGLNDKKKKKALENKTTLVEESSRLVRGISLLVNASVMNVEVEVTFGLDVQIWKNK